MDLYRKFSGGDVCLQFIFRTNYTFSEEKIAMPLNFEQSYCAIFKEDLV